MFGESSNEEGYARAYDAPHLQPVASTGVSPDIPIRTHSDRDGIGVVTEVKEHNLLLHHQHQRDTLQTKLLEHPSRYARA